MPDSAATGSIRPGSLRRAITRRLTSALAIVLLVMTAAVLALYWRTNLAVSEQQLDEAGKYFKARTAEIEYHWAVQAVTFRSQVELSRTLEESDPAIRHARLSAYITSFGGESAFTHVVVAMSDGEIVFHSRTRSQQDLPIPASTSPAGDWIYGEADRVLYRVLSQPIRLDSRGGRIVLYAPVDNELLGGVVYPNATVRVRWAGSVVAESPPLGLTADEPSSGILSKDIAVQRTIPWMDGGIGPQLEIEHRSALPFSVVDVLALLVAADIALWIVGWLVLGRWLNQQSQRLGALDDAAGAFAQRREVTAALRGELENRASRPDEVHHLARGMQAMMADIVGAEKQTLRLNRLNAVLGQVNRAIVAAPMRDELFSRVCQVLVADGGFRIAWIGGRVADTNALLPLAGWGVSGSQLKSLAALAESTLQAHPPLSPLISNDAVGAPVAPAWRTIALEQGFRSFAVLPVRLAGKFFGTLNVYAPEAHVFLDKEIALLGSVADDLSFALDNFTRADERRAADEALKRFAAIVESTDDAIIAITVEGIITGWNAAAADMFGYRSEEIIGRHADILTPPDQASEEAARLKSVGQGGHVKNFETVRVRKSGETFPAAVTISPIVRTRDGGTTIIEASTIVRDISERKRSEAIANRERSFSDAMIESMPGILYFFDAHGHFLRWNQNFMSASGYSAQEIAGMHPLEFFEGEDIRRMQEQIAEALQQGEATVEASFVSKDGRATPYFFTGRRLAIDGWVCLVGLGIDISEQKKADAALREYAMRLQAASRQLLEVQETERRHLARELHDTVGQELTGLSLNLMMIRSMIPPEGPGEMASRLEDSQELLEHTTENLRGVMVELRPPGIDELGLLPALKEHAMRVGRRSGLKVTVEGAEPRRRLPRTMEIAIFRIVQEALNNTVKHAAATEVAIVLEQQPNILRLTVADNGRGFDAFPATPGGLHGMGMTTMRERAEAVGARMEIQSVAGKGTRVIVDIASGHAQAGPRESAG